MKKKTNQDESPWLVIICLKIKSLVFSRDYTQQDIEEEQEELWTTRQDT